MAMRARLGGRIFTYCFEPTVQARLPGFQVCPLLPTNQKAHLKWPDGAEGAVI